MSKTAISYELLTDRNGARGAVFITMLRFRPTRSEAELLRKEQDWRHRILAADAVAHQYGLEVFVPPLFDNQFDERYPQFYPDVPIAGKLPDLFFDGLFWEVESYEGAFNPNHFTETLKHGKSQSPNIIVVMNHEYDIELLRSRAAGYIRRNNGNRNVKTRISQVLIVDVAGIVYAV